MVDNTVVYVVYGISELNALELEQHLCPYNYLKPMRPQFFWKQLNHVLRTQSTVLGRVTTLQATLTKVPPSQAPAPQSP